MGDVPSGDMVRMTAKIHVLHPAVRPARLGAHLKVADEKVVRAMNDVKSRLVRLRDALADLHATEGTPSRSRSPAFRGGERSISAALGR